LNIAKPRQQKVNTTWSPNLAYAIGVISSDGNVSTDLRHINITSKDKEMLETLKRILHLENMIGVKARGGEEEKKYFVLQFGDVRFVEFLYSIGITPNKSKTISAVNVPDDYFVDFLRGVIDGDGCIDIYIHPESKLSQVRVRIGSASEIFLQFLLSESRRLCGVNKGSVSRKKSSRVHILTFSKTDTLQLLPKLYYATNLPCLERKRLVARRILEM
jgi:intein/homing endonuclease